MLRYTQEDLDEDQIAAEAALYEPFTDAVRDLVEACVRTEVGPEDIRAAQEQVEAVTARLRSRQLDDSFGVRISENGSVRNHGNAVVGMRNAIAPPLRMQRSGEGRAWADFHLGAAYEGPPGLVHGGVTALILDQVCGEAAADGGAPGMTGTLTMRYRRGTPLGDLRAEAWLDRTDGVKSVVRGRLADAEGTTVECEGIFILPRWAREAMAESGAEDGPQADHWFKKFE